MQTQRGQRYVRGGWAVARGARGTPEPSEPLEHTANESDHSLGGVLERAEDRVHQGGGLNRLGDQKKHHQRRAGDD